MATLTFNRQDFDSDWSVDQARDEAVRVGKAFIAAEKRVKNTLVPLAAANTVKADNAGWLTFERTAGADQVSRGKYAEYYGKSASTVSLWFNLGRCVLNYGIKPGSEEWAALNGKAGANDKRVTAVLNSNGTQEEFDAALTATFPNGFSKAKAPSVDSAAPGEGAQPDNGDNGQDEHFTTPIMVTNLVDRLNLLVMALDTEAHLLTEESLRTVSLASDRIAEIVARDFERRSAEEGRTGGEVAEAV
jgi:hypothetical protein